MKKVFKTIGLVIAATAGAGAIILAIVKISGLTFEIIYRHFIA